MAMRNYVLWVVLLVVLSGCSSTFQSRWKNFNAYYNTYYNAQKSYKAGLEKNLGQERDYNPLQPIRIHPRPVNAGAQDFEKAIQKAADVLRRHEDSKWVDDALALIGKSYYFKREYFSADLKFKELALSTRNNELLQEAILWRGRVLLDMELYNEGVAFLSEELLSREDQWDASYKAEVKAILAQHYVELKNWSLAAIELMEALPLLPQKEFKERGFFLLGQVQERLDNTEAAFEAYNAVQNYYVEYRLQYLAQRKTAEVARILGRNDIAYAIFNEMVRDDKNLEYKSELDYELARTEHERDNYRRAEQLYKQVLHNGVNRPSTEIQARAYYGLAEIYRFQYDDFSMAAAYYDSAAQENVPDENLPADFKASELAVSFGNYSRIKNEISKQDSLLRLGMMSPSELESAIQGMRETRLSELERLRDQQEVRQNQLITVNNADDPEYTATAKNGFLNENNPAEQANIRRQFIAIWGERPLGDNWRVRSMIEVPAAGIGNGGAESESVLPNNGSELVTIEIDLSGVPFTPEAQDSVRKLISAHQYELGNLFYLSLNLPDSADKYFKEAIAGSSEANIEILSLYSLSELNYSQGNRGEALRYARQLVEKYPSTLYARRVADLFDLGLKQAADSVSTDPRTQYEKLLKADSVEYNLIAQQLHDLARKYREHDIAPWAQYEAIQYYMKAGMQQATTTEAIQRWDSLKVAWEEARSNFRIMQDSARLMLRDTSLSQEKRNDYQALVDSTISSPNLSGSFPYRGELWDDARRMAEIFLEWFDYSSLKPRVIRLRNELKMPDEGLRRMSPNEQPGPVISTPVEGYRSCKDLSQPLEIRGGMQRVLNAIQIPEELSVDSITYNFKVNTRGIAVAYDLRTKNIPDNVDQAFRNAFDKSLTFEPVLYQGQAVAVECELSFPVTN